jgi:hypothetical protein
MTCILGQSHKQNSRQQQVATSTMNGNTPATDAYPFPSVENDHDGHFNGTTKKRKEAPVATSSNSYQDDVEHVQYWKALQAEFEELEEKNSYSDILQFVEKRMPHLGDRSDLEAAAIPPVPAAVQEEPTPTLSLIRSDSSTFTEALLVAAPAALEASLIEINEILGNEKILKAMTFSKNTQLKKLKSQLDADVFRFVWNSEYTAVKKSLKNRMQLVENRMQLVEAKIESLHLRRVAKCISDVLRYRSICSFCQVCRSRRRSLLRKARQMPMGRKRKR